MEIRTLSLLTNQKSEDGGEEKKKVEKKGMER